MQQVRYQRNKTVAVITLDNPPVNGLGHALRRGIVAGIEQALEDPEVSAILIIGAGGRFSGGADIREFNTPKAAADPSLHTLIQTVEHCPRPVIAAIEGFCMGGGLELALGCHYRVATPQAQIALPEVKIGLLPGAGGTQRLPRAIGVQAALEMITTGDARPAGEFEPGALFNAIIEGDLLEGALAFAQQVAAQDTPHKRLRQAEIDDPKAEETLQRVRDELAAMAHPLPAPRKCIKAVAAAVSMPFAEGLQYERELFEELVSGPESKALRHAFFAERAASKIPDVPVDTPTRPIQKAAVIGAGTMGAGISMSLLNAGIPVTLLEVSQEALDRGYAGIQASYAGRVKKERMTSEELEQRMALLQPTLAYDDLRDVDLVIEAVFEEMGVKEAVFQQLDAVMKPGAILATNTSTLDVNQIAAYTERPEDVLGLHFFSPAHVMRLLEVVRADKTSHEVLASVMKLARRIGKTAVVSGVCDGFIGNRMLDPYVRQAQFMLEEGASPQQIDRALEDFGFAMGVFKVGDLAGNDIGWAIRKRRYQENPEKQYSRIADRLCEQGRFGQKTGKGWYSYAAGPRNPVPDPEVEKLIEDYRKEIGIKPRPISDEEIVQRCVFALVNEGARLLEERIAQRASDIDVVYLTGYGFPRWRGGPMFYADTLGLVEVVRVMERFAGNPNADPAFWEPAPRLSRLAGQGESFNG